MHLPKEVFLRKYPRQTDRMSRIQPEEEAVMSITGRDPMAGSSTVVYGT